MLSTRGSRWAAIDYAHGVQDIYHPSTNPKGVVSFANAENVRTINRKLLYIPADDLQKLMHETLIDFINKVCAERMHEAGSYSSRAGRV